ncbi:MAG: DUF4115 domain-containing protein [Cardiobacteriaceae bacterium]|nr:DUF4115 domain-containing protein [Cardiobacteriaceae bacterium]
MTEKDWNDEQPIDDIGALLCKTREEKGLSLASASMQTKLSVEIIEKLESNRFQEIGAPVFSRGYLSIYARFLGLNQAAFTRAFNALSMDTPTELRLTSANVASQKKSYKRTPWKAWLALVPLFALAGVIVLQVADNESWLMQQIRGAFASAPQETPAPETAPQPGTNDIILQIGPDAPLTAEQTPQPDQATGDNHQGMQLIALESTAEQNSSDAQVTTEPETAAPVPAPVPQAAELRVQGETWLEVKSATGRVVASAILKKGDTVALPLPEGPFSMNIGRPSDVVVMLGDKPVDLMPFRQKGSERRFNVNFAEVQ